FERIENLQGSNVDYNKVKGVAEKILLGFADNQFDQVSIIYNQFVNAITQNVVVAPLIPANVVGEQENESLVVYDYEPEQNELLEL
ncbi:MAG: F0F1 ATP synthase subunit gamma, partial [Pseudomonadota bacterium]|nr:F0F1 ATP synthase subunit gamma [Pseudomonadota bacterium]